MNAGALFEPEGVPRGTGAGVSSAGRPPEGVREDPDRVRERAEATPPAAYASAAHAGSMSRWIMLSTTPPVMNPNYRQIPITGDNCPRRVYRTRRSSSGR